MKKLYLLAVLLFTLPAFGMEPQASCPVNIAPTALSEPVKSRINAIIASSGIPNYAVQQFKDFLSASPELQDSEEVHGFFIQAIVSNPKHSRSIYQYIQNVENPYLISTLLLNTDAGKRWLGKHFNDYPEALKDLQRLILSYIAFSKPDESSSHIIARLEKLLPIGINFNFIAPGVLVWASPLLQALRDKRLDVAEFLLRNDADINFVERTKPAQESALEFARRTGYTQALELMAKYMNQPSS